MHACEVEFCLSQCRLNSTQHGAAWCMPFCRRDPLSPVALLDASETIEDSLPSVTV